MNANNQPLNFDKTRSDLENNGLVSRCACRYGNMGDPTSMKACYLLRHYPELSVSQLAELAGVSISAMSRCLQRLNHSEIVVARREKQTVYYSLLDNDFTRTLMRELSHQN